MLTLTNRKELDHRQTLYDLITQLSATLNFQKVLETSLDLGSIALSQLGAPVDKLTSAVLLFTEQNPKSPEMSIASGRRLLNSDRNVTFAGLHGALSQVIEEGVAVEIKDPKL